MKIDYEFFDAVLACVWNLENHPSAKAEQINAALVNQGINSTAALVRFHVRLAADRGLMQLLDGDYWRLTWAGHEHVEALENARRL